MLHEPSVARGARGPEKGATRRGFGRLRKLPSKRWQAAYTGPDGVLYRAPQTFEDEDAARGWLNRERRLIDNDEWMPPLDRTRRRARARLSLEDFAATWLAGRELKPRTRSHYQRLLDRFILPSLGGHVLASITAEDIEDWYADTAVDTPTYRAHAYALLRTILAGAVERGTLPANPAHIRGAGNVRRRHKVEPLTLGELGVLVDNMPERHRLMVLLAAWCALRFGELTELRRHDVDMKNARVKVRRGVVRVDGAVVVGSPKSEAGSRDVAIPPHLIPALREHLAEHVEPGRDALLFPAENGGHLSPSSLYGANPRRRKNPATGAVENVGGSGFYAARAAAGRPDLHFHDLRHTGAVLAAQTGATLAELMARLGHSTPAAAMRYQHAARDRDAAIAKALSEMTKRGEL